MPEQAIPDRPDFQSLLLPILEQLRDGRTHRVSDLIRTLIGHFASTEGALHQAFFAKRVGWSVRHLVWAGLIVEAEPDTIALAHVGKQVLAGKLQRIDLKSFYSLPEFRRRLADCSRKRVGMRQPLRLTFKYEDIEIGSETLEELEQHVVKLNSGLSDHDRATTIAVIRRLDGKVAAFLAATWGTPQGYLLVPPGSPDLYLVHRIQATYARSQKALVQESARLAQIAQELAEAEAEKARQDEEHVAETVRLLETEEEIKRSYQKPKPDYGMTEYD